MKGIMGHTFAVTANLCKWAAVPFIALMHLCGCKAQTETVPVEVRSEVAVHDTIERVKLVMLRDSSATHTETSTVIKDSIAPIFDSQGRLTGFNRFHSEKTDRATEKNTGHLLSETDSLKRVKDKVEYREKPVPYPVVKEVERKKTWWEATLNALGWIMIAILLAFTFGGLAYLYLKCKKKEIR